jgi:hypothetical protein
MTLAYDMRPEPTMLIHLSWYALQPDTLIHYELACHALPCHCISWLPITTMMTVKSPLS